MAISPSADPEHGLFSLEEQATLKAVERSKIWRLVRDALMFDREQLLSSQPATSEALWLRWGEITRLSRLLREGPQFVIFYRRAMEAKARAKTEEDATEPGIPGTAEPPNFDDL